MIFSQDIGIDLGTSSTALCIKGKGVVYNEPSVVAMDAGRNGRAVRETGKNAQAMIGRTPGSVSAVRPVRDGVIADYAATTEIIRALIARSLGKSFLTSARVMINVPAGATEVERRAVHMAARDAGARYVSLIESPCAAAIGAGLPVMKPSGLMVVDIGGGCTEAAIISMGDVVTSKSVKFGGEAMNKAVASYFESEHNLLIGSLSAENVKIKIGSVYPYKGEAGLTVSGRMADGGLPASANADSAEIREALIPCAMKIISLVKSILEKTPPELTADILENGICLTGGGALLRGLDALMRAETGVPVTVADDPALCVINGISSCLENNSLGI